MVCDLMVASAERRFGRVNRLPAPIEWLSDNGSPYTARETRRFARDMGFVPVTTPIESPQSNGMAEAMVKTIKRDYARVADLPDARAVMAIVQRPLGAPIALASEHLRSAADLAGKTVGITGVPSDRAALDTTVAHAGGDPAKVRVVTIGFNGVPYLEAGRIAAFTGYWPDDGATLQVSGYPITVFKLDANGGPAYPGLVAFTTRSLIARDPSLVRAFVRATVHGYEDTLRDPQRSLADLLAANPSIQRKLARASLTAYLPVFDAGGVPDGKLVGSRVAALSRWLVRNHLIARAVSVARYGTNAFLP